MSFSALSLQKLPIYLRPASPPVQNAGFRQNLSDSTPASLRQLINKALIEIGQNELSEPYFRKLLQKDPETVQEFFKLLRIILTDRRISDDRKQQIMKELRHFEKPTLSRNRLQQRYTSYEDSYSGSTREMDTVSLQKEIAHRTTIQTEKPVSSSGSLSKPKNFKKLEKPAKKEDSITDILDHPSSLEIRNVQARKAALTADLEYFWTVLRPQDKKEPGTKSVDTFLREDEKAKTLVYSLVKALNDVRSKRAEEIKEFKKKMEKATQENSPEKKQLEKIKKKQEKAFQKQYVQGGQKEIQGLYDGLKRQKKRKEQTDKLKKKLTFSWSSLSGTTKLSRKKKVDKPAGN